MSRQALPRRNGQALPDQIEAVANQLHTYTPLQLLGKTACPGEGQFWSVPDLARFLKKDYGIVYDSTTSYRSLLKKCGMSYQRPAKQYKSHSEINLQEFEELLEKKTGCPCPICSRHRGFGGGGSVVVFASLLDAGLVSSRRDPDSLGGGKPRQYPFLRRTQSPNRGANRGALPTHECGSVGSVSGEDTPNLLGCADFAVVRSCPVA